MSELEKIIILSKLVQGLKGIVIKTGCNEIWLKEDAFENIVRELMVGKDICHRWYSDCDEQFFYYENIRFYTIYNEGHNCYMPEPEVPDTVYEEAKAEVEKHDLV